MAHTLHLLSVTLPACEKLLRKHPGQRLYCFLKYVAELSPRWRMEPHDEVPTLLGWREEYEALVAAWRAEEKGFRAFMLPQQFVQFRNPRVELLDGMLVIRSGKEKIISLE